MPDNLSVERHLGPRDGCIVLSCKGPITIQTLFTFQNAVRELNDVGSVIIDLTGVPYMDSAGLGALVGAHISSRHASRTLVLVGAGERITALIRMSNLEKFFPMYSSVSEAVSTSS
jgi:anti-sigma B factor antagonist